MGIDFRNFFTNHTPLFCFSVFIVKTICPSSLLLHIIGAEPTLGTFCKDIRRLTNMVGQLSKTTVLPLNGDWLWSKSKETHPVAHRTVCVRTIKRPFSTMVVRAKVLV